MAYKISLNPNARLDIIEAIDWYNEQQAQLGLRFYKNIQATIKSIQKNPLGCAVRYKTIRTAIVRKFPYMLHYIVYQEFEVIEILAVISMYQNPDTWIEKTK